MIIFQILKNNNTQRSIIVDNFNNNSADAFPKEIIERNIHVPADSLSVKNSFLLRLWQNREFRNLMK